MNGQRLAANHTHRFLQRFAGRQINPDVCYHIFNNVQRNGAKIKRGFFSRHDVAKKLIHWETSSQRNAAHASTSACVQSAIRPELLSRVGAALTEGAEARTDYNDGQWGHERKSIIVLQSPAYRMNDKICLGSICIYKRTFQMTLPKRRHFEQPRSRLRH